MDEPEHWHLSLLLKREAELLERADTIYTCLYTSPPEFLTNIVFSEAEWLNIKDLYLQPLLWTVHEAYIIVISLLVICQVILTRCQEKNCL
jgi:hypothetical protein